jgi:hypothetical protein
LGTRKTGHGGLKFMNLEEELGVALMTPLKDTDTIQDLKKKFVQVMKKYKIKTWLPNDRDGVEYIMNPLWTVYRNAYIKGLMDRLTFDMAMEQLKSR